MTGVPTWLAAVAGQPGQSGAVNQFHAFHSATYMGAQGTLQSSQTTGTGIYQASYTNWLSTTFQTGVSQTTIGTVKLQLNDVGGSPTSAAIPTLSVSLYTDNAGVPGSVVTTSTLTSEFVYTSGFWVSVPMPTTGLAASTNYHIVTQLTGSSSHYYAWQQSTQGTGAATAPDGATWTTQSYGLMYEVYDFTGSPTNGLVGYLVEDGGLRWTQITYNSLSQPTSIAEYTAGPNGTYIYQSRNLTYTNGLLTGIS